MPYDKKRDRYRSGGDASAPGSRGTVVVPSDTVDLPSYAKSLRIGTAGTIRFLPSRNAENAPIDLTVTAGEYLPWQVRRVFATGTTATGIVANFD